MSRIRRYLVGWRAYEPSGEVSFYQYAESIPDAIRRLQEFHGFDDEKVLYARLVAER